MLLGSDNNDNKLFGAEGGDTPKEDPNPSGFGSEKLFDNSGNNSIDGEDDLVTDSFMLSMKANDPETVSEKLKDTAATAEASAPLFNDNATPSSDNLFGDDDELSNFEFDSSISAFKPLSGVTPAASVTSDVPKAEASADGVKPAPAAQAPEAPKAEAKDVKPEPPLFIDDDPDFKAFAEAKTNEDPFKAGEDLDFAMSTKGNSNEFGSADDTKIPDPLDDLELDEEALAISPFKPKNDVAETPKKEEPAKAEAAAPAPAAPAAQAPKAEEPKDTKEATPSNIHTYGNVKSGVNAFAKKTEETKAPSASPEGAAKAAPVAPAPAPKDDQKETPKETSKPRPKSPFNKQAAAAKAHNDAKAKSAEAPAPAAKPAPKTESRPAATHSPNTAPMPRPIPPTQRAPEKPAPAPVPPKAQQPAPKAQPAPAAQLKSAPQNAVTNQRPGMSAPEAKNEPSPFAPKGAAQTTRPAATSRPAAKQPPKHSTTSNIQPVTPVAKNRKSEGGKVAIIALVVIFLALFLVILGLENYDKIFKADPKETITETTPAPTTETEETTTTAEATTTTEATTETTTEATTEETTTEETTTEETTVEETTEATTEATTTTAAATDSSSSASYRYSIANPHSNGSEFSFDLVITDTGNVETNLTSSIEYLDITFDVDPDSIGITGISSDYYTFTQDANDPYTFHGTPTSGTVPAGGALNTTITCTTTEPVQHFYISTYHFQRR